ncbi:hypothetical protein LCGC14_1901620 [marine sediment metagenome]|uniref:Sulfotransferase domain-containing protein n=1 Tax=marine sediment metagenome TaxID=412755 RepID=A0A0F9IUK5_9ZZZZ
MCNNPIFITGVYRSGSTLIAQIINNHPKVRVIYDTLHFFRFYLGRYDPIHKRYREIVKEAAERLNKRFSIKVPSHIIIEKLNTLEKVEYKDVYSSLMKETFCNGKDDLIWGEKSLLQWSNIPTFLNMYPEGKTIQIIRDPRDVLTSYREFTIEPKYRYLDAIFTCLHSLNWIKRRGKFLPEENFILIRYEDLVHKPEQTIKKLCNFLQIKFTPIMLDSSKFTNRTNKEKWKGNSAFNDIKNEISPISVNRWRTKLDVSELILLESIIDESLLEEFGYLPSDIKVNARDLQKLLNYLKNTPLIQKRLFQWLDTGEGVEKYPSDPTNPDNWEK